MECPEAVKGINAGDEVQVDLSEGVIANLSTGAVFKAQPFPPFIQEIIEAGGLLNNIAKKGESK